MEIDGIIITPIYEEGTTIGLEIKAPEGMVFSSGLVDEYKERVRIEFEKYEADD